MDASVTFSDRPAVSSCGTVNGRSRQPDNVGKGCGEQSQKGVRMSTLSHPHLMTIHDSGEAEDGTLYLVMPFISGGDLRALLKRDGRLPPARAARIMQVGAKFLF